MISLNPEFEYKPKVPIPAGYVLVNYSLTVGGTFGNPDSKVSLTVNQKREVEIAYQKKLINDIEGKIAINADAKKFGLVIDAIKTGDVRKVAFAIAEVLGIELAFNFKLTEYANAEVGVVFDACPLFLKPIVKLPYEKIQKFFGIEGKYEVYYELGFYLGLSPLGWQFVAQKLGSTTIKSFLQKAGPRFAALSARLIASGVIAPVTIVMASTAISIALLALTAKIAHNARTNGTWIGLAEWYKSAYIAKVFHRNKPSGLLKDNEYVKNINAIKDEMIKEGEADALTDAKATSKANGIDVNSLSDKELLNLYWEAWIDRASTYQGKTVTNAKSQEIYMMTLCGQMVNEKIKKKFNIEMP